MLLGGWSGWGLGWLLLLRSLLRLSRVRRWGRREFGGREWAWWQGRRLVHVWCVIPIRGAVPGTAGFRLLLPLPPWLLLRLRGWRVVRLWHRFGQGFRLGLVVFRLLWLGLLPPCRLGLLLLLRGLLWGFRLRVRLWLLLRLGLRLGLLRLGRYRVLLLCGCGVILAGNA